MDDGRAIRAGAFSAFGYAAVWSFAAIATGVSIEFEIDNGRQLLETVAEHRVLFTVANLAGLGAQLLLVPVLLALWQVLDRRTVGMPLGLAWWALAMPMFAVSSIAHASYALVPGRAAAEHPAAITPDLVREAEVLHHFADLAYFAGMLAVAAAVLALRKPFAGDPRIGRVVAAVGVGTAVATVGQLGWLVGLDALQGLGIVALIGQVVVLVLLGLRLRKIAA